MEPTAASAVYLDVVFDEGLLFFDLVNAGSEPSVRSGCGSATP